MLQIAVAEDQAYPAWMLNQPSLYKGIFKNPSKGYFQGRCVDRRNIALSHFNYYVYRVFRILYFFYTFQDKFGFILDNIRCPNCFVIFGPLSSGWRVEIQKIGPLFASASTNVSLLYCGTTQANLLVMISSLNSCTQIYSQQHVVISNCISAREGDQGNQGLSRNIFLFTRCPHMFSKF